MSNNVFVNEKLTLASTQSDNASKRLEVFLRPTEKNEFFRFRLLWFKHEGSNRKTPYIERWIHQIWEDDANGKRKVTDIICPISKHVASNWPGNPYDDCPICNFANMNFVAFKDSNWTDKAAQNNSKTFKRKYDLVVPVYVVSDPCYAQNAGRIKVFRINDSKIGETFKKMIIAKSAEASIFNGGKALDFLIRMDKVKYDREDGTFWTKNEIVQMGFSTKEVEIKSLTPKMIDEFPFDDIYGAIPTMADLKDFHKKYCLHATTDDIDFDGMTDMSAPSKKTEEKIDESSFEDPIETSNLEDLDNIGLDESDSTDEIDETALDDIPDILRGEEAEVPEVKSVSAKSTQTKKPVTSDIDVDDLLASVGFND